MSELEEFKWQACGSTDVGKVRSINEDAFLDKSDNYLWAVADGMGGHAAGDVASRMVVNELNQVDHIETVSGLINSIEERLLSANEQLLAFSREELQSQTVGSTVVGMVGHKNQCIFFWVGDSRLYRLRDKKLSQLSEDHTEVARLVSQGLLSREEADNHPDSNTITRAVGAESHLFVDFDHSSVLDGDIYLLCSDGLDKELSDLDIERTLNVPTFNLQQKLDQLMETTLIRGARDNVTIILVEASSIGHN